jgi:hypothetical protein
MPFDPGTDIRGSHTIRIFGTNKDQEVLQDIWLDIERIDIYFMKTQVDGHWQGVWRKLYWFDDPQSNDYAENHPSRFEGTKKICSPDESDQENPEQWVPVKTIIEMTWNESTDDGQWQGPRGNRTDGENEVRLVEARRCFHHDATIDKDVDAATSHDPKLKAYVVASDQYDFVENSDDKGNYIEVQYVSCTLDLSSRKEDAGKDQGVQTSVKNSHYLNFTDEAQGPVNPVHGFDPPWALDPFQAIVNVKFRTLYLIVAISGANQSFVFGLNGPAPSVTAPTLKSSKNDKKSARLLDTVKPTGGANSTTSGFTGCFIYLIGPGNPQNAWTANPGATFGATNNSCPWPGGGPVPDGFAVAPVNFEESATSATFYLYAVPAGDETVTLNIDEIVTPFDSGLDTGTQSRTTINGSGTIDVRVFSRVHGSVTKISDLIDINNDGKPRPTEDDRFLVDVTHSNQGEFMVNVHLDNNKDHVQTDNYGKSFQPYKVTTTPLADGVDHIPDQPPPRLETPQKVNFQNGTNLPHR